MDSIPPIPKTSHPASSALAEKGWKLIANGSIEQAEKLIQELTPAYPLTAEDHYFIGHLLLLKGQQKKATKQFELALKVDPNHFETLAAIAQLFIQPLRNLKKALHFGNLALNCAKTNEEKSQAHFLMMLLYKEQGNLQKLSEQVQSFPQNISSDIPFEIEVGRFFYENRFLAAAKDRFERIVNHDTMVAEAHFYLGLIASMEEDENLAMHEFLRSRVIDTWTTSPPWTIDPQIFQNKTQDAISKLPDHIKDEIEGALVICTDLPGVEAVADGINPRTPVLAEYVPHQDSTQLRIFVYQKNVERNSIPFPDIDEELALALKHHLQELFSD